MKQLFPKGDIYYSNPAVRNGDYNITSTIMVIDYPQATRPRPFGQVWKLPGFGFRLSYLSSIPHSPPRESKPRAQITPGANFIYVSCVSYPYHDLSYICSYKLYIYIYNYNFNYNYNLYGFLYLCLYER